MLSEQLHERREQPGRNACIPGRVFASEYKGRSPNRTGAGAEVRWQLRESRSLYKRRSLNRVERSETRWHEAVLQITENFWWRCAYGTHPYPSRTRRLSRKRPKVLHWRRCGRIGGRQIKKRRTGRKPAEQRPEIGTDPAPGDCSAVRCTLKTSYRNENK